MFLHSAALKQIEDASPEHESVKSMKMRKRLAAGREGRERRMRVAGGRAGGVSARARGEWREGQPDEAAVAST